MTDPSNSTARTPLIGRLQERGVIRVALSYAVIAWLILQIGDVTLDPLGAPRWVMRALVLLALTGFPIALALAWFFELTPSGIARDDAPPLQPRPTVGGVRRYADVAVIGALALTVAFLLLRQSHVLDTDVRFSDASVAVLPFENTSAQAADEYVAIGLSDELRDQLARVPALRVISRSSSQLAQQRKLDPPTLATQLGVAAIVEGRVRRDRERVRATVELVDGRDGSVIWSASYDRSTAELLTVQSDIAAQVVNAVLPQFVAQGGAMPAPATSNVSAQDLYLLASQAERRRTPDGFARAHALYEQAIALDPRYAAAHAALGRTIAYENQSLADTDPDALDRLVLPHIDRALEIDRSNGEAYMVKGYLRRWTLRPGGEEFYRLAAELDPNNWLAHTNLVAYADAQNRPDIYYEHALRARDLDPLKIGGHTLVVWGLMMLGKADEIPAAVTRMMDVLGSEPRAAALACHARSSPGRHDERLACALAALRRFPDSLDVLEAVANACADIGDLACVKGAATRAAALGDEDSAAWLLYEQGDTAGIRAAIGDFLVDPRDHLRAQLLASVALAAGLDEEALHAYRAAAIERATRDDTIRRKPAMQLALQMLALEQGEAPQESGRQLDTLLEWTARPLEHGGREYLFHIDRAFALTLAGRTDEAISEIEAATDAPGAPFDVRQITDCPVGRMLGRDPRLAPLLQKVRDRQTALRAQLPATLQAAGVDPAELAAIQNASLKPT